MNELTRANATLVYFVFVLVLGGASAAGLAINLALQLAGAGLIGWTLWSMPSAARPDIGLRRFAAAIVVLAAIQFLPLPPMLWKLLPGREEVFQGYILIGATPPWLTVSLAPWNSLASLAWWLPALAVFLAMRADDAPPASRILYALVAVATVSVLLGALQRGAGIGYLYRITNYGQGPGFFANSNHQGSFLLLALALWGGHVAAEIAGAANATRKRALPAAKLIVAGILIFGVLVSGSLACVALLVPVCAALAVIARPDFRVPLPWVIGGGAIVAAGFLAFLLGGTIANDLVGKSDTPGISRYEFLRNGLVMLRDFAPTGSGLGTFQDLYRWYEEPAQVGSTFVNHAHDDLLELLIETGIFGLAALVLFMAWLLPRGFNLWKSQRRHGLALGASVAIATVMVHSLVDYPLRTAAMSAMLALACALIWRAPEQAPRASRRRDAAADDRPMLRI